MNAGGQPVGMRARLLSRAVAGLALLVAGWALGACRHVPLSSLLVEGGSAATVEPGPYAGDARVAALLADWPQQVARAQERVALLTGLSLADVRGEACLCALGDEGRESELRVVLRDGRRQPRLRVNLERVAPGRAQAATLLARGIVLGVLEVASLRSGVALPPWALALAAGAAAGDLQPRLERMLAEDVLAGRAPLARVDPGDPAQAESTGMAALLLLLERGGPERVRAFLQGLADGDEAAALLQRLAREHADPWPVARGYLAERMAGVDLVPWRLLGQAERAWQEAGRAGLLAVLPPEPPAEARDELLVLGARAALAEGDLRAAHAALSALGPEAAARLRDPLAASELRVRLEAAEGGDQALAQQLAEELGRDYPRSGALERLRTQLRLPEDPARVLQALEARAEGPGLEALDVEEVRRLLDLQVKDLRHGAAARVLERLGERAAAPELAGLAAVVAREQGEPSGPSLEAARGAVAAWAAAPAEPARAVQVVDRGTAGARALAEALGAGRAGARALAVGLLGRTAGAQAVPLLAAAWEAEPSLLAGDLDVLAAHVRVAELEVWVRGHAGAALERAGGDEVLAAVRLDLDEASARRLPDLLTRLRSPSYALRREAFDLCMQEGLASQAPRLVARMLADPSPLLRRDAAFVAGAAGFEALLRAALEDPAYAVRQQAALGLGEAARAPESLARLQAALAGDESPFVRAAAASGLWRAAPALPATVQALLEALGDEHPLVVRSARSALAEMPPRSLAPRALDGLGRELARKAPRGPVLEALFAFVEAATGSTSGYYPGMPLPELQRALARQRQLWAATAARGQAR